MKEKSAQDTIYTWEMLYEAPTQTHMQTPILILKIQLIEVSVSVLDTSSTGRRVQWKTQKSCEKPFDTMVKKMTWKLLTPYLSKVIGQMPIFHQKDCLEVSWEKDSLVPKEV